MLAFFLYGTLILCHKCAVFPCAVASSCRPPVLLCACELARHKTLVRCAPPTGADPAGLNLFNHLAVLLGCIPHEPVCAVLILDPNLVPRLG